MKLDKTNTIFCTGMWYFKENVKRDLYHYFNCIPQTFKYIDNQKIYFFYNHDKILERALDKKLKKWYEAMQWSDPIDKQYTLEKFF